MLSERAGRIRPSGIRKMFERAAQMQDPIDFSIGQPHFEVPEEIQRAAIDAIRTGKSRYSVTQGIPELGEKVSHALTQRLGRPVESSLITAGVSGGLLLSYFVLLDPGDEILVPEPYFVIYRVLAELLGAKAVYYDTYPDFRLTRAALDRASTERTKVLLLNSPANPTGSVLSEDELRVAADFARQNKLVIISDEIYEAFVYDGPHRSVAEFHEETVVLGGFSKSYAMPGWRLGYAAGPAPLLEAMSTLQQFTFVCANTVAQHAAVPALDLDLSGYVDDYRRKRDRICAALAESYHPVRPGGSFYLFLAAPAGETGATFAEKALAKELLVVPGKACSERDTHFRLSFAVDDAMLERGIDVLNSLA